MLSWEPCEYIKLMLKSKENIDEKARAQRIAPPSVFQQVLSRKAHHLPCVCMGLLPGLVLGSQSRLAAMPRTPASFSSPPPQGGTEKVSSCLLLQRTIFGTSEAFIYAQAPSGISTCFR